ncbi:hypothetical protein RYH73_03335 [Olivibacter sp. CPCC 100613]|uniref:4'-phosphopantetheinyl transferase family protein n=1 Tax=Olivibacter sp. CPCC 100613 TaxID=3079931 RepID=UPI002FF5776A
MEKYAHIHEYGRDILYPYSRFFPSNHLLFKTKNTDRKLESLLGLKLLSDLLLKIDSQQKLEDIQYEPNGKPYFPDADLYFSIAHSQGMVLVSLEEHPVGIDLEFSQPRSFTMPEIYLNSQLLTFTGQDNWINAWVHQEAALKMFGWNDLRCCQMIIWDSAKKGNFKGHPFHIQEIKVHVDYYAAKCSEQTGQCAV